MIAIAILFAFVLIAVIGLFILIGVGGIGILLIFGDAIIGGLIVYWLIRTIIGKKS